MKAKLKDSEETTGVVTELDFVIVTAADFNGTNFDGSPFRYNIEDDVSWLQEVIDNRLLVIAGEGCTDYARWKRSDKPGSYIAGPDDLIVRMGSQVIPMSKDLFTEMTGIENPHSLVN